MFNVGELKVVHHCTCNLKNYGTSHLKELYNGRLIHYVLGLWSTSLPQQFSRTRQRFDFTTISVSLHFDFGVIRMYNSCANSLCFNVFISGLFPHLQIGTQCQHDICELPDKLVVLTFYCRGFLSKVEAPISNQDLMGNLQGAIILIRLGLDFDQAGNQ